MHQNTVQKVAVMLLIIGLTILCHLVGFKGCIYNAMLDSLVDINCDAQGFPSYQFTKKHFLVKTI